MKKARRAMTVILLAAVLALPLGLIHAGAAGKWVTAWTTSMVNGSINVAGISLNDVIPSRSTTRTEMTLTTGGSKLRLQFSNQYGNASITIRQATVAKTNTASAASIVSGSAVPVTFGGSDSVVIPAGKTVWSDEIAYETSALDNISVSMYYPYLTYMKTVGLSNARTYLSIAAGNECNQPTLAGRNEVRITSSTITYHTAPFICAVETLSPDADAATAVFIGDSTLVNDTYLYYAQRLADAGVNNVAVVNQAIVGNRLLSADNSSLIGNLYGDSLKDRFERDVLSRAGVKYCFVKIGLNDILHQYSESLKASTPKYSPADIIAGYTELVNRCHAAGIKIYFFTKSAWNGYSRAFLGRTNDLVWSKEAQEKCDELSRWAKTNTIADGFIDCFPLADPSDTSKLCSTLTLDGAHLSMLGAVALADLIPLDYVGAKTVGRSAAAINGVNPYAEKNEIITHMDGLPTYDPDVQIPSDAWTEVREDTPGTQTIIIHIPATTSAQTETPQTTAAQTPQSAQSATTTTAAAPTTTQAAEQTTASPANEYTVTVVTEPYSVPAVINGGPESPTETQKYTYTPAYEDYNISDTADVSSIGTSGGVGFILALFMVILVSGAIVILNVSRKREIAD